MARRFVFASEIGVGETTASNLAHSKRESLGVGHGSFVSVFAVVVSENLFVDIARQMERLNSNVGSTKATLQEAPEVLQAIRVDSAVDVPFGMINNVMNKVVAHFVIADCVVCVDLCPVFDVLKQNVLESLASDVRDDLSAYLAKVAVQYPLYYRLSAVHSALLNKAELAVFVHVLGQAAYKRFISFYFRIRPTKFRSTAERPIVESSAKALQHKPSGFLGDPKRSVNLHAGNSVLAIDQHPESGHPLIQPKWRILEDSPNFQRELLVAAATEPNASSLNEVIFLGAAPWAEDFTVRPTELSCIVECLLRIGEVNDGLL